MDRRVLCCSAIDIQQWLPALKLLILAHLPAKIRVELGAVSAPNLAANLLGKASNPSHPSSSDLPPALFLLPPSDHNAFLAPEMLPLTVPKDIILIMRTSGSTTGTGKMVGITLDNLLSSAQASATRLGTSGKWAIALPCWHIAGLQCAIRSLLAGYDPVFISQTHFSVTALTQSLQTHPGITHISLVPTQLQKCLADPQAVKALSKIAAILVGGAHIDPDLLSTAKAHHLRVVTTYGSTESSGGCVYDGVAFSHTSVDITAGGRVTLTGPTISPGYLHMNKSGHCHLVPFTSSVQPGGAENFSFPTNDHGELKNNILHIYGRLDDAITSGGETISPLAVESVICPALKSACQQIQVADLAISYLPDSLWGQAITLVLQCNFPLQQTELSYLVKQIAALDMPKMWRPKYIAMVSDFPYTALGKLKRNELAHTVAEQHAQHLVSVCSDLLND